MPKIPSMSEQLAAKVALLNQIEALTKSDKVMSQPFSVILEIKKLLFKGDKSK